MPGPEHTTPGRDTAGVRILIYTLPLKKLVTWSTPMDEGIRSIERTKFTPMDLQTLDR